MSLRTRAAHWKGNLLVEPNLHDEVIVSIRFDHEQQLFEIAVGTSDVVKLQFTNVKRVWCTSDFLPTLVLSISIENELFLEADAAFVKYRMNPGDRYIVVDSSYGPAWVILQSGDGEVYY